MKKYLKIYLLCISPLILNGSERPDSSEKPEQSQKVRKALSDSMVIAAVKKSESKNKLTSSAPMNISQGRRKDPDLIELKQQSKSPSQGISTGDYYQFDLGQSCSPSPQDYAYLR